MRAVQLGDGESGVSDDGGQSDGTLTPAASFTRGESDRSVSPNDSESKYLILRNFRAEIVAHFRAKPEFARNCGKISTVFFQPSEITFRKTYPLFCVCIAIYQVFEISKSEGARKLIRAKISNFRAEQVRENLSARKFLRIRYSFLSDIVNFERGSIGRCSKF